MAQAAPGKWVPTKDDLPPDMALAKWIPNQDGTYSLVPEDLRMVRLNFRVIALLGFEGAPQTLRRLGRMGAIELIKIAPHCTLLNLDSYYNHLRRCAEDPDLWDADGEYYAEYRKARDG